MARTFNRAYDQADRMLNTSGLSSIVYRDQGGPASSRNKWNFAKPRTLEWQDTLKRHTDRLREDEERRYSGQKPTTLNPGYYSKEAREVDSTLYDLFGDPREWFGNKEKTRQQHFQLLRDVLGYDREESEREWNLAGQGFKREQDSQGRIRVTRRPNPRHISRSERDDGISSSSPQTDHTLFGLEGYSEVTDPSKGVTTSFIDDVAIDSTSGLKHGGQPMPGGLSNLNMIKRELGNGGLIQLAEGSTGSDPYRDSIKERYNVEEMSDKKLADELAREDILRSSISDEDLRESGLIRIRTRPWAISQGEEFEKRKGGDKTAHIRKLYYLSLKRLLNEVKQNADRTGNSFPYEKMQRIVDKGMTETFPEGYAEPIAPEYMGKYGMHKEPGDTQDFKDAYSGGGYPGPSFVPNLSGEHGQTAPVFESSSFEEIEDQAQSKKEGGGISNLKKSININGQPHSLAWINPDEASALRAMGGSGKKGPWGIPSYQTDEYGHSWDFGPTGGYEYGTAEGFTGDDTIPDTGYNVPDYTLADRAAVLGTTVGGLGPIGTAEARQELVESGGLESFRPYEDFGPLTRDKGKIILHSKKNIILSDEELEKAEREKREEEAKIRNSIAGKWGTQSIINNPGFPIIDFETLMERYSDTDMYEHLKKEFTEGRADIFGAVYKYANKEAQENLKDRADDTLEYLENENTDAFKKLSSKEKTEKAVDSQLSNELDRLKEGREPMLGITDLTKAHKASPINIENLGDAAKELLTPGKLTMKAFSALREGIPKVFGVWGTGTVNGRGVYIKKDGTIEPFVSETERENIESGSLQGENVEPEKLEPSPVQTASVEEVKKPTGIAAELAKRPEVASLRKRLLPQFNNIVAAGFSEQEAADMLGVSLDTFIT